MGRRYAMKEKQAISGMIGLALAAMVTKEEVTVAGMTLGVKFEKMVNIKDQKIEQEHKNETVR